MSLFDSYFSLHPEDTDVEKYAKLSKHLSELWPERAAQTTPFMATLLGIQLTDDDVERVKYLQPPQVRERVFQAVQNVVEGLTAIQPLVLVFEDLHWVDPTSLDLIEQLMSLTDRVPLLLIGIFRPWRQELSWRFHETAARDYQHRYTAVPLEPLDESTSRELVGHLLHVEDLPEKVRALILAKAEGNPFFVEEVIRSLLDGGLVVREDSHWRATREIENIAVPDTLAGVITARLDQLNEESKRVAQTASVIGREYQYNTLDTIHDAQHQLEESLTDLQRQELVRETSRVPQRVYMFKHALTQETAYASLLMSRRRELHLRVAECLEKSDTERVNDIARHFLEAREPARALPYLVEAGDRAARAYATPEAIGFYDQALEILETVDDLSLARRVYEGLGGALTFAFDIPRAVETYDKMVAVAQAHDDLPMQVSALNKKGFVTALMKGELQEAEQLLQNVERLANACGDLPGLAEMHVTYCYIRTAVADFNGALAHQGEAAQLGNAPGMEESRLFGLTHTANTLTYMTRFDEAWQKAQEARQLAEEIGNLKYLSELHAFAMPFCHLRNGDLDAAYQTAHEGMTMAAQIGASDNESSGALMLGIVAGLRGDYEQAITWQQRSLQAGRMAGLPFYQASALCTLGATYLNISMDMASQTAEYHGQAMQLLEMPLGSVMGTLAWAEIGFCHLAFGNVDAADDLFQKGLTTPTAMMHLVRPQLLVGAALVAMARNKLDDATNLVQEAQADVEERAMNHFAPLIAFADAQVSSARGDSERALERFLKVEELALAMQMRPLVWQAQAGAARVLSQLGRSSEADAKRAQAQATIDEIAGLFEDETLRAMFVETAISKLA